MLGVCQCGKVKAKAAAETKAVTQGAAVADDKDEAGVLNVAEADDKAQADLGLWFCVSKSGGVKIITARKEVTQRAVGVQTYI